MKSRQDIDRVNRLLKSDPIIKEIFRLAGPDDTWLVGGLIRDILLTGSRGRGVRDYDFVTKAHPAKLARKLKLTLGGTIVNLRDEQITRLVLKNKHVIDLSLLAGSLEDDLRSRDYTINSMAWRRTDGIIDPMGELEVRQHVVALNHEINLFSDPLRIFRAYRIASCNSLGISDNTRKTLKKLARYITKPAKERLTYELSRLISGPDAIAALKMANEDGVLKHILGMDSTAIGCNINRLGRLRSTIGRQPMAWLNEVAGMGMQNRDIVSLNALLLGADRARLTLPSAMAKRFKLTETGLHTVDNIDKKNRKAIYSLLIKAGDSAIDIALISGKRWVLDEHKRLIRIRKRPLISANTLINDYGIKEGPEIGRALKRVEMLRFTGRINRKSQLKSLF